MAADYKGETDEVLMMRFQGGDRDSFAILVRRHKTPIFNFILRQIRNHTTAEDLTQDVFVRVVRSAASFKHEARFTTWIYSIARNLCIDHLRKMSLRRHPSLDQASSRDKDGPTLGDRIANEHPSSSAHRQVTSNDIAQRVGVAVEALPPEQIGEIVAAYGDGARRMAEAGLDGVELVSSMGYLISQFLTPRLNRRDDINQYNNDI